MRRHVAALFVFAIFGPAPAAWAQATLKSSAHRALSVSDVARLAAPATVTIIALSASQDTLATGSGFIVRGDGSVVTCWHVMQGASRAVVMLATGERYDRVTVEAADSALDLAVLKIPGYELPALRVRSSTPAVGETAIAIGSPLGLSQTVSTGIVSASRILNGRELVQVTAPISPGSSGGPILDNLGRAFAVADMFMRGGQQLNFAVPARYAMGLLAESNSTVSIAQAFSKSVASNESHDSIARGVLPAAVTPPERMKSPVALLNSTLLIEQRLRGGPRSGERQLGVLVPARYGGWLLLAPETADSAVGNTTVYFVQSLRTNTAGDVALDAGGVVYDGYQTDGGGFFATASLGDSAGTTLALRASPFRIPLSENTGLYDVSIRTPLEMQGIQFSYTDWNGILAVADNDDSLYVILELYNDAGGSTSIIAKGPLGKDGTFDLKQTFQGDDWRRLYGSIRAGVIDAHWIDSRKQGRYTGTLDASRK